MKEVLGLSFSLNKLNVIYLISELRMCLDLYDLADTLEYLNETSDYIYVDNNNKVFFSKKNNDIERNYIFELNDLSIKQVLENGEVIVWYEDGFGSF